jgi:two-component system CheB/CheR fusion protein
MHAASGLWVDADGDRLQQVVINLVGNGIKFTPRGGRVTITVASSDGRAQVTVEDTGVGIEADRLQDLFEMFRQGEVAARRAPGLGIGLALVKSITELHGGRVWAESAGPGRGSRFTVELPRCEPPEAHGTRPEPASGRAFIRMLLVEDNADTRMLLAETMAARAYEVVPAESGEEALDILKRESVDVIVADIGLPGIDGYEFLRQARRLPSAARSPAFALTGYGRENDVQRAHGAGYVDHLTKPIDIEVLDQRIRSHLSGPPPRD